MDCAICYEKLPTNNAFCTPCGHSFHHSCSMNWFATKNTCPCCRTELYDSSKTTTYEEDEGIEDYIGLALHGVNTYLDKHIELLDSYIKAACDKEFEDCNWLAGLYDNEQFITFSTKTKTKGYIQIVNTVLIKEQLDRLQGSFFTGVIRGYINKLLVLKKKKQPEFEKKAAFKRLKQKKNMKSRNQHYYRSRKNSYVGKRYIKY